jgi:uncharacterized damage-inducible protein DinB
MTTASLNMDTYHKRFAYNAWANRDMTASLLKIAVLPLRAQRIAAHLAGAEELWFARLHEEDTTRIAVWPDIEIAETATWLKALDGRWMTYLGGLTEPDLSRPIPYTNSKGEHFTNTIGDILEHVLLHASYHRGQIATAIREVGGEPAYTDYIEAIRKGYL